MSQVEIFGLTPSAEEHIAKSSSSLPQTTKALPFAFVTRCTSAFEPPASRPGIGHVREDLTNRPLKFWSVNS